MEREDAEEIANGVTHAYRYNRLNGLQLARDIRKQGINLYLKINTECRIGATFEKAEDAYICADRLQLAGWKKETYVEKIEKSWSFSLFQSPKYVVKEGLPPGCFLETILNGAVHAIYDSSWGDPEDRAKECARVVDRKFEWGWTNCEAVGPADDLSGHYPDDLWLTVEVEYDGSD